MVHKDVTQVSGTSRSTGRDFAAQPAGQKAFGTVLAPAILGAVSGLLLGATAIGYWVVQVVAIIGGVVGGTEHVGWRAGLLRGLVGGAIYGSVILLVRAITGWSDRADLGETPGFLVVITTVIGLLLGALGGALRARRG